MDRGADMLLIRPTEKYLSSYAEAVEEDAVHRPRVEQIFGNPARIIETAFNDEHGIDLRPGYVRATTLWLIDNGRFIGESGIRHELTPALLQYGGHIGYEIRWSESRKGYGTKMLAMVLQFCKEEMGMEKVLITCDDDNIGSIKVIQKNGGVLENKVINHIDRGVVTTRRYWIAL